MARSQKTPSFKYVTVEQDDSELVIVAGSHGSDSADVLRQDADVSEQVHDQAASKGGSTEKNEKVSARKPTEKADDSYHETTLDDLNHEPMSKMQRAVLLGIAVLVVVFVAYMLFF